MVLQARLVNPVRLAKPDLQGSLAYPEKRVTKELLDPKEALVYKDPEVIPARLATLVCRARLDLQAKTVSTVKRAARDLRAHPDHLDLRAQGAPQALMEAQDQLDQKGSMGSLEMMARRVTKV